VEKFQIEEDLSACRARWAKKKDEQEKEYVRARLLSSRKQEARKRESGRAGTRYRGRRSSPRENVPG
jgi:hypothetical protein